MTIDRADVSFLLALGGVFYTDDGVVSIWDLKRMFLADPDHGLACPKRTLLRPLRFAYRGYCRKCENPKRGVQGLPRLLRDLDAVMTFLAEHRHEGPRAGTPAAGPDNGAATSLRRVALSRRPSRG